jgi:hypothetical protein
MSKIILRQTEIPKEWTQKRIREKFPTSTIVGSQYGYWFHVEQTNVVFVEMDWRGLVKSVTAHLKGNGHPVPADIDYQMMVAYCAGTNSPACGEEDLTESLRQRYMTMASRFLRAMEDAVMHGLVPQEEAERRSAICARCPQNQAPAYSVCEGCSAAAWTARVAKLALGRSTSNDHLLRHCAICSCDNKLKVFVRKEAMKYPELEGKWDSACWMIEGN